MSNPSEIMSAGRSEGCGVVLPWRLLRPENSSGSPLPLLISIHGMGSVGTDNIQQVDQCGGTVRRILEYSEMRNLPFLLLAPQTPVPWVDTDWGRKSHRMKETPVPYLQVLLDLIIRAASEWNIDRSRILLTGSSMGGFCCWELLQRRADLFAGALICCGGGDTTLAKRMAGTPVWCTHGTADPSVPFSRSTDMVSAVNACGGTAVLTPFPGVGHNAWDFTYSAPPFLDWLFAQHLPVDVRS